MAGQEGLEVFQKDAPGHAVDGEVVDGEAEAAGAVFAGVEEGGADERAGLMVEGGLQLGAVGFQAREIRIGCEEVGGFLRDDGRRPNVVFLMESQAQRGMAGGEFTEGAVKEFGIGAVAEGEEERLVPVVGISEVLGEEPALDGREGEGGGQVFRGRLKI